MGRTPSLTFGIASLVSLLLVALFPGDVPFVNDEPRLLEKVWTARENGEWWILGLKSFSGISYGPLPLALYRLLLALTPTLWVWVLIKALVGQMVVVGGLWWGVRRSLLHPTVASFLLFSPYLYLYQRSLWDNCFLVPLALIATLATQEFLRTQSARAFAVLSLAAVSLIHVHLMSLLLLVPIALGIVVQHFREFRRWSIAAITTGVVVALIPYGWDVIHAPDGGGYQGKVGVFEGLGAAITATRILSFPEFFSYFFPGVWEVTPWGSVLRILVTSLFLWVGVTGYGVWTEWKEARHPTSWHGRWSRIAIGVLVTVFLVHWLARIKFHPHYANATWPIYLWFLSQGWVALLKRVPRLRPAFHAGLVLQALLLIGFIATVRHTGGDRLPHYGATLTNQLEVARALGQTTPTSVEVRNYQLFPHTLEFLQKRYGGTGTGATRVRYRNPRRTGWIEAARE